MKLILYGTKADTSELTKMLSSVPELCYRNIRIEDYSNCDSFLTGLSGSPPDGIIVAMDGADGMEGVIAAKIVCRNVPFFGFRTTAVSAHSPTDWTAPISTKSPYRRRFYRRHSKNV